MRRKLLVIGIILVAAGVTAALIHWPKLRFWQPYRTTIQGAVIRQNADAHKQVPIEGVQVTAMHGTVSLTAQSDASGYFKIRFPGVIWPGQTLILNFRGPGYKPLDLQMPIRFRSSTRQLIVAAMTPTAAPQTVSENQAASVVSNILVRYTVNSEAAQNIGSEVKTFQVVNESNVPCMHQAPCSPDGLWKASLGSIALDAGVGNEFQDVRVSCIAGPCPFTSIDSDNQNSGGRTITVTARDWSDTATFLLEAEVFHTSIVANVRESYPAIFGRTLTFTLPLTAEGVSLEAELNTTPMVFPLGPDLFLSWASCSQRVSQRSAKPAVYQCDLKPGYRF